MAAAPLPRLLIAAAIAAAGCVLSLLVSAGLRPTALATTVAPDDRRRLSLLGFRYTDPKTVELRRSASDEKPAGDNGAQFASKYGGVHTSGGKLVGAANAGDAPPLQPAMKNEAVTTSDGNFDHINNDNFGEIIEAMASESEAPLPPPVQSNDQNDAPLPAPINAADDKANAEAGILPYNIDNALITVRAFRYTLFFFVYDSASDTFVIVHNVRGCDYGCARIYRLASSVGLALRRNFPDWFSAGGKDQKDWVAMISCGDAPRIKRECLTLARDGGTAEGGRYACGGGEFAPIFQFGSVFVDAELFPSMIAMPLPVRPHMPCFEEWQVTSGIHGACQDLQPRTQFADNSIKGGMIFGEELGILDAKDYWEKLIPQIIWRGTDFQFLHTMFPDLRAPSYKLDIEPYQSSFPADGSPEDDKRWAIETLWKMGDEILLPRWRGILMTSEAEVEVQDHAATTGETRLPWVNIKFASVNLGGIKVAAGENEDYILLNKLGIAAIGEHVNMTEQAKYRYHIDLGGGGGTTWTGTIEKLALPGVLFHHVTPTKDWFHDLLVPWEHYIPVETNLRDLREKFEWAEAHPKEAKQIAIQGTEFARWMGTADGFAQLYEEHLVAPLRYVLEAYRPLPLQYEGKSVLDVILESGAQSGFTVVGRCSGMHTNSCEHLV